MFRESCGFEENPQLFAVGSFRPLVICASLSKRGRER
jgi:hypothetical protein